MSWSKSLVHNTVRPIPITYKYQASREAVAVTRAASRRPSRFMARTAGKEYAALHMHYLLHVHKHENQSSPERRGINSTEV